MQPQELGREKTGDAPRPKYYTYLLGNVRNRFGFMDSGDELRPGSSTCRKAVSMSALSDNEISKDKTADKVFEELNIRP